MTIDRAGTVAECCELMVHSAGLEGRLILKVKVKKSMRPSLSVMAHMLCHNEYGAHTCCVIIIIIVHTC